MYYYRFTNSWKLLFIYVFRILVLDVIELWNTYPSIELSSSMLHIRHLVTLIGLWMSPAYTTQRKTTTTQKIEWFVEYVTRNISDDKLFGAQYISPAIFIQKNVKNCSCNIKYCSGMLNLSKAGSENRIVIVFKKFKIASIT